MKEKTYLVHASVIKLNIAYEYPYVAVVPNHNFSFIFFPFPKSRSVLGFEILSEGDTTLLPRSPRRKVFPDELGCHPGHL